MGIIVVCAVVFCIRRFMRSSRLGGDKSDDACGDCPLKSDCNKSVSECDNIPDDRRRGGPGSSCGCC